MRLVLGTSVLVAAIRSRERLLIGCSGQPWKLLPLASVPWVLEYEAVLTREEHLAKSDLSREEVQILLFPSQGCGAGPAGFHWRPMLNDPEDDLVLETATNGNADALVTFNQRNFLQASRFGMEIISPKQAWERVGKR